METPLAASIRPKNLDEFVGQAHLVGDNAPIRIAIEEKYVSSFILWGPPGVGKTTLARIYAQSLNADYHELSAVSAGKDDIRKIVEEKPSLFSGGPTILFLDEIHRFNKAQQDFLLPYVESGQLVLIGATTENPSFEVISALLSRLRVFSLKELSEEEIISIIERTGIEMDAETKAVVAQIANGDARQALSLIDNTRRLYATVTVETIKQSLQDTHLRFDRNGEEHHNTVSAFIKSMRASQPDAAAYYLARMLQGGEDPKFIARRMVIFASEDIGMEDPHALIMANAVFRAVETVGLPECGINLSHGAVYLAEAPKNRAAYNALNMAMEEVKKSGNLPVPLKIRNAPTKLMKDIGYGAGYEKYTDEDLLPDKLKGKKYYKK